VEAAPAYRGGRTPRREHVRRRKDFIRLLTDGVNPVEAARRSGHPAEKALATLSELGFTLSVLEPEQQAA
jgi:hypothetical protein